MLQSEEKLFACIPCVAILPCVLCTLYLFVCAAKLRGLLCDLSCTDSEKSVQDDGCQTATKHRGHPEVIQFPNLSRLIKRFNYGSGSLSNFNTWLRAH